MVIFTVQIRLAKKKEEQGDEYMHDAAKFKIISHSVPSFSRTKNDQANWGDRQQQSKRVRYQSCNRLLLIAENKVAIFRNDTRKYRSIWPKQLKLLTGLLVYYSIFKEFVVSYNNGYCSISLLLCTNVLALHHIVRVNFWCSSLRWAFSYEHNMNELCTLYVAQRFLIKYSEIRMRENWFRSWDFGH